MSLLGLFRSVKSVLGLLTGKAKLASRSGTGCLVVGLEASRKYGACPGSAHDSQEMGRLLKKYGSTAVLRDRGASRAAVKEALREIVKKDLAVFHYSGHGGRSGGSEFLCLDDGPMWDHEIWDIVSQAKGRVVLVFDCCHSGHMYRDAGDAQSAVSQHVDTGFEFLMLRTAPMAAGSHDILVWSGCPVDSYSYGDSSGGVFTNGILKGCSASFPTYGSVWSSARRAASGQNPVRTVIGSGFDGPVFR